jgi:hypothetical protein
MGIAGLLLYSTPRNDAANFISVNYTYDEGNPNNNNGGGSPATPEPGVQYLSALAAGAMTLMLIGRNLRRRGGAKPGEDAALPVL